MSLKKLKSKLTAMTREELEKEIAGLYKRFTDVKDYYDIKDEDPLESKIFKKALKTIGDQFYPARGCGRLNLAKARKAISDFKKLIKHPLAIAELMLHYVENGIRFTNDYGDIDERFYCSMESMFASLCKHVTKNGLGDIYKNRLKDQVDEAPGGWGFRDGLSDTYYEYFGE